MSDHHSSCNKKCCKGLRGHVGQVIPIPVTPVLG